MAVSAALTSMKPWSRGAAGPRGRQHRIVSRLDPTALLLLLLLGGRWPWPWSMKHTDGSPPEHVLESAGKTGRAGEVATCGNEKAVILTSAL